jgi:beta-alanine degradation protein BauB
VGVPTCQFTTSSDDDRVRVNVLTFQDGDETGHHVHEFDYVVVPVTGGTFLVIEHDGSTRELTQRAGEPYVGRAGTEHNVINRSGAVASFAEIELKR